MPAKAILLLLFVLVAGFPVMAQTIHGEVLDKDTHQPVEGVTIENIYTALNVSTNSQGGFIIAASAGELLEFKKDGYKIARARIPQGYIPSWFRIIITKGFSDLKGMNVAQSTRYNYAADSIKYRELYKHALNFPKMSGIEMISSPFTALSRRNREMWRFQEDFEVAEREKYIDRTFNEALVTKFTGLTGDSLHYFMRRYRPTYEQLRSMNDYSFFNFIKSGVYRYRSTSTPRNPR